MIRRALVALVATVGMFSLLASVAAAKDGRGEVRMAGVCGRLANYELRLKRGDRGIGVRFEIDHIRAGVAWRVAIVHERRVAWKGSAKTTAPSGSFEVRRTVPDLARRHGYRDRLGAGRPRLPRDGHTAGRLTAALLRRG